MTANLPSPFYRGRGVSPFPPPLVAFGGFFPPHPDCHFPSISSFASLLFPFSVIVLTPSRILLYPLFLSPREMIPRSSFARSRSVRPFSYPLRFSIYLYLESPFFSAHECRAQIVYIFSLSPRPAFFPNQDILFQGWLAHQFSTFVPVPPPGRENVGYSPQTRQLLKNIDVHKKGVLSPTPDQ